MLPPGRELKVPAGHIQSMMPSGVLLPIFPENGELFACMIKRSATMKIHAGQIGFPGGKQDQNDATAQDTALRETSEEIGLNHDEVEILGELTPLYVSVSNFMIYPFVAWIDKRPMLSINRHEVEKMLFFPLISYLSQPEIKYKSLQTVSGKLKVPGISFEGEFIWGATAMILMEFLDILNNGKFIQESHFYNAHSD